ncbi:hypothetical protein [Pedobacter sp. SYSU D00535]|uniref:hypothetical protein n=1 Tax=Pedobacter sp. SYSU D00535 TaxID=2810308 RepID=UPI001A960963|nr:hypothetical protein [Pedobacter sp. SYSU D00535]
MKSKRTPLQQFAFLTKYLEGDNDAFLENISSHIGHIVIEFNLLEERLTALICRLIINDIDATGLIITQNMNFSSKVDLLNRHSLYTQEIHKKKIQTHEDFIEQLKESARLRNLVVHADWSHADLEGFAFVKLRIKDGKMDQEFIQLDEDSLIQVRNTIIETYNAFDNYEEKYNEIRSI